MQTNLFPRSQRFCKILHHGNKQVLVALGCDESDDLVVMVSLWSDSAEMQVSAKIHLGDEDRAEVAFDALTQETIAAFIDSTPLGELVGG